MIDAMRKSLILDDLILACQAGRITRIEKDKALWIMGATGWTLENVVGIPTDLRDKILAACPLLRGNSDVRTEQTTATIVDSVKELEPVATFGLSSAQDKLRTYNDNDFGE